MAKIVLINPNYYKSIFGNSKVRSAISKGVPPLGLLCIAASLIRNKHTVKILNLNLDENPDAMIKVTLNSFKPEFVGITSTTPLIKEVYRIADLIKGISENITIIAGGPHPTALPREVLETSNIDCVVYGEGDVTISSIIENGVNEQTPNIFFKKEKNIFNSQKNGIRVEDLDGLPLPAYELLDISQYRQPLISSRKSPLGYIETSRGCFGQCIFCNKNIHGSKLRMKSPKRVVDEMQRMLTFGFKEIHIIDDLFTADMKRAQSICEEIIRRNLRFPWYPRGGIRVDRVNLELLKIMKRAGCYRIPFGIESGCQRIIDRVNKKITLNQAQEAVKLAKRAGLETECYFMLGLPTETEEDIEKTINFAIKLDPDYAKFAITIPLPGTKLFSDMQDNNQIKTTEWEKYNFSNDPSEIYTHDTLSWGAINKYYGISHKKFYFRLNYILRMIVKTLRNGTFLGHVKGFFKTRW